jgi:hypothetical protein
VRTEGNEPFPLGTNRPALAIGVACDVLVERADVRDRVADRRAHVLRDGVGRGRELLVAHPQRVRRDVAAVEAGESADDAGVPVRPDILDQLRDRRAQLRVEDLLDAPIEQV